MYCGNNPVMRVDPSGMAWWDVLAWVGVGLVALSLTVLTAGAFGLVIGGTLGGIIYGAAIGTLLGAAAGTLLGAATAVSVGAAILAVSTIAIGINEGINAI